MFVTVQKADSREKKQCWVSYVKISLSCQQLCNVLERGEVECGIETVLATCMLRLHTDTGVLIAPCKLWTKKKKSASNVVTLYGSYYPSHQPIVYIETVKS